MANHSGFRHIDLLKWTPQPVSSPECGEPVLQRCGYGFPAFAGNDSREWLVAIGPFDRNPPSARNRA